jgi:hypothetical protein
MPAVTPPEGVLGPATDTFALVERDLSQAGARVVERSRRSSSDPGSYKNIVNLAEEVVAQRRELASLKDDVRDLKRDAGTARWVVRGLLAGTLAALVFIAERVWSRAEAEGRDRVRLENVERIGEENRQDLRAIRARER